jgi:hypothetical protein
VGSYVTGLEYTSPGCVGKHPSVIPATLEMRQKDHMFSTSLGSLLRLCLKIKNKNRVGCIAQW